MARGWINTLKPPATELRFAGVDPGRVGASVVVDQNCAVVLVLVWGRGLFSLATPLGSPLLSRPYRELSSNPEYPPMFFKGASVVAIEQPYLGKNVRSALSLATGVGHALAQVDAATEVVRPTAAEWRAKVFGGRRMGRAAAKETACLHYCRVRPEWVPWELTADEAEAWAIARYAWGYFLGRNQNDERIKEDTSVFDNCDDY